MIDPSYLIKFKEQSNEDFIAASLILNLIDVRKTESILDVGAGTGVVSCAIQKYAPECKRLVFVEPSDLYDEMYPADVEWIQSKWENCAIEERFDLVVFCHILGDFSVDERFELLVKASDLLSEGGLIVSVENGPNEVFDRFVRPVFKLQGDEFFIDFIKMEHVLDQANLDYSSEESLTYLCLGKDKAEAIITSNLFFPRIFNDQEREIIKKTIEDLHVAGSYAIPVNQKIYIIKKHQSSDHM